MRYPISFRLQRDGGVGFVLNGNLLVRIRKDSLLARIDPERRDEALRNSTPSRSTSRAGR